MLHRLARRGPGIAVILLITALPICVYLAIEGSSLEPEHRLALWAELLLVAVLAVEGTFAYIHLNADRKDARDERLYHLMTRLASPAMKKRLALIYEKVPWGDHWDDLPERPLDWKLTGERDKGNVVYKTVHPDGSEIKINVGIERSEKALWFCIFHVLERYHTVGFLCAHGHVETKELLNWHMLTVRRLWGRFSTLVQFERKRRKNPNWLKYFDWLAVCVGQSYDKLAKHG